jgi:hypothetical protein
MKFISVLFLIIFIAPDLIAQNEKKVNGVVRSAKDKELLSFASVGIEGTGIGTITNEAGRFSLNIPAEFGADSVRVSYLGFRSLVKKIKEINADTIYFNLEPESKPLAEVLILPPGVTAESIFREAVKHIPDNYSRKPFYQLAFYREMATLDNTYTRLLEAAVEIQDFGYDASAERRRIKVIELRKSNDFIETDWRDFLVKQLYGSSNDLIHTLDNCDIVRKKYHSNSKGATQKGVEFSLKGISKLDGEEVFVIEAEDTLSYLINQSTYLIKKSDYAILQINASARFAVSPRVKDPHTIALLEASRWDMQAMYKKVGDKYYLFYGRLKNPESTAAIDKKEMGKGQQFKNQEILVNNILTSRHDWDRVKRKVKQEMDSDIYKQDFEYHPGFWANYTILLRNPLLKQIVTDLNRGKTLEQQFYDNGD